MHVVLLYLLKTVIIDTFIIEVNGQVNIRTTEKHFSLPLFVVFIVMLSETNDVTDPESCTYQEVRLVEVIGHVPANFAVFASLLHDGVEEGENVHQAAEGGVWAAQQGLQWNLKVCGPHVQLQTVRGLRHHLDTHATGGDL